jgi:hypothetical protein
MSFILTVIGIFIIGSSCVKRVLLQLFMQQVYLLNYIDKLSAIQLPTEIWILQLTSASDLISVTRSISQAAWLECLLVVFFYQFISQ